MTYNIRLIEDGDREHLFNSLLDTGASPEGCEYMLKKGLHYALMAEGLSLSAALIVKQEALAKGAEASINRLAVMGDKRSYNVLLLANVHQYELLAENLKRQPFGLPSLAGELEEVIANISRDRWRVPYKKGVLELGKKTYIMGILNITPDSFYDGGKYFDPKDALSRARQLVEDGADIIDIGGASSRPSFLPVTEEEEKKRVLPVIEKLAGELNVPISIDSDKGEVAEAALEAGASIINDICGLQSDPYMAEVVAKTGAPVIIMRPGFAPQTGSPTVVPHQAGAADVFGEMTSFFRRSLEIAAENGIDKEKIILDPGIGFGTSTAQDLEILRYLPQLKTLGLPILIGSSNKKFIGYTLNAEVQDRKEGTAATVAIAIAHGAAIVRVHDVWTMKRVAAMSDAIMGR